MIPDRWQQVRAMLAGALERAPADRAAYLDQVSSDPSLRREVESLLAHEKGAERFLEEPALEVAAKMLSNNGPGQSLIGAQIGSYQVLSLLGAGGMGEVYRARDTKLGRDVAIKVLPEAFAYDAERLARFQREAKMLAQLNHTNIATIYGLEHSDGTHYLTMELVPGDTLQQRVKRDGAVPIEEALAIAKQIAEALEAAHEKGIIHRDLKPANVKLTPEGKVKVLDFGLAKAIAGDTSTEDMGNSPTLSVAATMPGVILGTAAYMSPEQARGKSVDKRADIWAFGCVLYELLTARPAIRGETISDIIAAVLEHEPDWEALPASTPATIRELLRRCLQKDPQRRLRDLGDARIEIDGALAPPAKPEAATKRNADSGPVAQSAHWSSSSDLFIAAKQHKWGVGAILTVALIILGAAGVGVFSVVHHAAAKPFQNFTMTQITNSGNAELAAISPDGRFVLSALNEDGLQSLWLRNIPSGSDTQVVSPSDSQYQSLQFSPDGNQIYFRKGVVATGQTSDLYRVPMLGGTPQKLVHDVDSDITFSPDGHRIAYIRGRPQLSKYFLLTSTLEGSEEKVLQTAPLPETGLPGSLAWDASGNRIAYSLPDVGAIDTFDLGSGKARRFAVFEDKWVGELAWLPDGQGILIQYGQNDKSQIGFLFNAGKEFQPITRDANSYYSLTVSADGRSLAAVQAKEIDSLYILGSSGSQSAGSTPLLSHGNPFDRFNWTADGNLLTSDGARLWRMGHDGRNETELIGDITARMGTPSACGAEHLVFSSLRNGANRIWRTDADGSGAVELTRGQNDHWPFCSPDQKWVYYLDLSGVFSSILRVPLDGSGKPEVVPITTPAGFVVYPDPMSISPNGETLACTLTGHGGLHKLALLNLNSTISTRVLDMNPHFSGFVRFTPDGKSVAYAVLENGVDNVWVQPLDGSAGHLITNFNSGKIRDFHWSLDGKSLGILRSKSESDVVLLQESKP